MYKAYNFLLPVTLQSFFTLNTDSRLRNQFSFKQSYVRTTRKSNCISVTGIKLWNNLNINLRKLKKLSHFKLSCKRHLFQDYKN